MNRTQPIHSTAPWLIVTLREIMVKVTNKAFWIGIAVTMLFIIGGFGVSVMINSSANDLKVAVVSDEGAQLAQAAGKVQQATSPDSTVTVVRATDRADAEAKVQSEDVKVALVQDGGQWTVIGKDDVSQSFVTVVGQTLSTQTMAQMAEKAGVSPDELTQATTVSTHVLNAKSDQQAIVARILGVVFGVLFMFSALTYGMQIAQSVVEEKQSRIVEILVSLVPVRQVLTGKVLGNTVIAVAQTALLVVVALVGASFTSFKALVPALTGATAWFVVFFIAGFLALACVWAAAGSMCTRNEDLQQTSMPMMTVIMIAYMAGFLATGVWKIVLSYVPITSSVLMPVRMFEGSAQWWEAVLSLLITLVFAGAMVSVGSRIYRRALLRTQGRLSFGEALRLKDDAALV